MKTLILAISISVLFDWEVSEVSGQTASTLFDAVPAADRESLRHGLSEVVSHQINRQWTEMYRLYDNAQRISLQRFIHDMHTQIKLVEFSPTAVTYIPPSDDWRIDGVPYSA